MNEEINAEPEKLQQVTIEEAIQMYEAKIQEQTNLLFGLVGKLGGSVTLTQADFDDNADYNTVNALANEDGGVTLSLGYEERPAEEEQPENE